MGPGAYTNAVCAVGLIVLAASTQSVGAAILENRQASLGSSLASLPNIFTSTGLPNPASFTSIRPATFSAPFFSTQYVYAQSGTRSSANVAATARSSAISTPISSSARVTSTSLPASSSFSSTPFTLSGLPSSAPTSTLTSASAQQAPPADSSPTLSARAIGGIVAGLISVLILVGALCFYLLRRRSHHALPQKSPDVYPEEAYLYDPPVMDLPPRAVTPQQFPQYTAYKAPAMEQRALGVSEDSSLLGRTAPPPAASQAWRQPRDSFAEQNRDALTTEGRTSLTQARKGVTLHDNPFSDPVYATDSVPSDFDELERTLLDPEEQQVGPRKPTLLRMGTNDSSPSTRRGALRLINPDSASSTYSVNTMRDR